MEKEQKDIFDLIMSLPILNIFEPFYKKHKEGLLYLFFGGLAFFLSIFLFWLFISPFKLNELIANILCWFLVVYFAFTTNRIWVFRAQTNSRKEFFIQMKNFYIGRVVTLLVEEVILFIFITLMGLNSLVIKIIAQIVVIVLNYVISKLWIFKKDKNATE